VDVERTPQLGDLTLEGVDLRALLFHHPPRTA
jgi:hypothetical protein